MKGRSRIRWGVLIGFVTGIAILAPSFGSFDPADAAQRTRKARTTKAAPKPKRPAVAAPAKDSAIVVDGALTAVGPDVWQRFGIPREAAMHKNRLNRGTTGAGDVSRALKS